MQIELRPEVRLRLQEALRRAGRREIGGMIFAEQLSAAGHFCVVDFSLDTYSGSTTRFNREPGVHRRALEDFYRRTGYDFTRFNYLGEWHSHPSFSVHPSLHDIATMTDLVETSTEISFAILLIVRLRLRLWMNCTFTAFSRGVCPTRSRIVRMLPRAR